MKIAQLRDHINVALTDVKTKEQLASAIEVINGELTNHQKMLSAINVFPLEGKSIRGLTPDELNKVKSIYTDLINQSVEAHGYQATARVVVSTNLEVARSCLTVRELMLDLAQQLDTLETNWWKRLTKRDELYNMVNERIYSNALTNVVVSV